MAVGQLFASRSPGWLSVSPCSAGPALVVVVSGEADWGTAGQLRDELTAALSYGPRSLVLDLTDLDFCSLPGLRVLMAAVATAERAGVDVTMHGMSRQLAWMRDAYVARQGPDGRRSHSVSGTSGAGSRAAALTAVPFL